MRCSAAPGDPTRAPCPAAPNCPIFPADNHWNLRVDRLPRHPNSDAIVRSIGLDDHVHADFGSGFWDGGPIGIPFATVGRGQRSVPVQFEYASESDGRRYPLPRRVPIEGGPGADGDRHVIVVDRSRCRLFELFAAYPQDGALARRLGCDLEPALEPDAPARLDLGRRRRACRSCRGSPDTTRCAAGASTTLCASRPRARRRAFVYPARHFASDLTDPNLPAMGQRLRLRRGFDISGFPRQSRIVLRALKRYGMILADNGSPWFVSGAPNSGWDNDDLHALHRVPGSAFEVVDSSRLPRP